MSERQRVEVLVVGAGPVGLTAAHELARRGIAVRLVDAASGPAVTSRAIATHARTLETYDAMGVVDDVLALGQRIEGFTMFNNGSRLVRLDADYRKNPTAFPYTLSIDQVRTEAVLRDAVTRQGVTIEWETKLADLTQTGDGVRVSLQHVDSCAEEPVTVPWVVGCDGGHSTVRKKLELPLVGDSNDTWLLADTEVTVDLPRNSIYWIRVGTGTVMLVPLPGENRWRLLDTVDTSDEEDPAAVAERFAGKLKRGLGRPVTVELPSWVSVFTAQQRMVPAMRVDRCLVAGDAAHVHSPASGQGMNTGIQEAYNLAWKLAMVVRGQADLELLDSYGVERVPIGRALLESTRTATRFVALRDALAGVALPVFFGVVRNFTPLRTKIQNGILGQMSALNVSYVDSPLSTVDGSVDGAGSGPRPGTRLTSVFGGYPAWPAVAEELRDVRWTLLVLGEPDLVGGSGLAARLDKELGDRISVRTVVPLPDLGFRPLVDPDGSLATALGGGPGSWLLVRPDGYLAARGATLDRSTLHAALSRAHVRAEQPPVASDAAVGAAA